VGRQLTEIQAFAGQPRGQPVQQPHVPRDPRGAVALPCEFVGQTGRQRIGRRGALRDDHDHLLSSTHHGLNERLGPNHGLCRPHHHDAQADQPKADGPKTI